MLPKSAIKDTVYGGLVELARNPNFYHCSSVGSEYSHLTAEGREVVRDYIEQAMYLICIAEEESLNKRAKEMVINGLKGESV